MLALSGLRRLLEQASQASPEALCQRCGAGMTAQHGHVADLETRALLCVCARCLADATRVSGVAEKPVPRRFHMLGPEDIPESVWASLEVPVGIAFFFHNSRLGRSVAAYPSPAGATESLLPPAAWEGLLATLPPALAPAPDVEALLVRRTHEVSESFIVPIDACYELVGRIRSHWTGFGGGPEAREAIDRFFLELRASSASAGT